MGDHKEGRRKSSPNPVLVKGQESPAKVFISYRRDGGAEMARLTRDALQRRGYRVFMDVEDLRSGPFNTALFAEIETATDMVVVLTPGCLDRCSNPNDWVRLEVAHAIQQGKNVVPVMTRGFSWPISLPEDLAALPGFQGVPPSIEYFEASMDKLAKLLVTQPEPRRRLTGPMVAGLVVVVLACIAAAFFAGPWSGRKPSPPASPTPSPQSVRAAHPTLAEDVGRLAGRAEFLTRGLVAYYPLSGNVQDASGNGHDGDPCGTLTYVEGPVGYSTAIHFGGTGNLVDLGTFNPSAGTDMITVALWAKWDGVNGTWQGLIGKRDTWAPADMMWEIVLNRDTGALGFSRPGCYPDLGGPAVLPIGVWTHVAVTFDSWTATLYIDGQKTGSAGFAFDSDATARIQLGSTDPTGQEVFNGAIAEVRIYNRPLAQSEVLWLAVGPGGSPRK